MSTTWTLTPAKLTADHMGRPARSTITRRLRARGLIDPIPARESSR